MYIQMSTIQETQERETENSIIKPSFVYLLQSTSGNTYVGATMDVNRRLRQHNKEIKGGAYATGAKVNNGEIWQRVCYVKNFPDWKSALQFEWRWKQISRTMNMHILPVERRINALDKLLSLDRPTTKAIMYSEWNIPPEIVWEVVV